MSKNYEFKFGRTLLHMCAQRGVKSFITVLLSDENVNVNGQDHAGLTPLMFAIQARHLHAAVTLIENPSCDVTLKKTKTISLPWTLQARYGRNALSFTV